jgi:hypothetical protein
MSEWVEVGKPSVKASEVLAVPSPVDNPRYKAITEELKRYHIDLIRLEKAEKLRDAVNSPGIISDYLGKIRLGCSLLFEYSNRYIDVHSDLMKELAEKRQKIYEEGIAEGKTPSASETHASAMTKVDSASIKIVENRMQQIKNEYERYNGICMYLQSKLKEYNTERIMN